MIEGKEISLLSFMIFPNFPDTRTPMMVLREIGGIQFDCWTANTMKRIFRIALIQVFKRYSMMLFT